MVSVSKARKEGGLRNSKNMDSIGQYLREMGNHRLLSREEEIELSRAVKLMLEAKKRRVTEGDNPELLKTIAIGEKAFERMIQGNLKLVISIAKKYCYQGIELSDLIQEGNIGLKKAVERFDPIKGYKFSTYAYYWI